MNNETWILITNVSLPFLFQWNEALCSNSYNWIFWRNHCINHIDWWYLYEAITYFLIVNVCHHHRKQREKNLIVCTIQYRPITKGIWTPSRSIVTAKNLFVAWRNSTNGKTRSKLELYNKNRISSQEFNLNVIMNVNIDWTS